MFTRLFLAVSFSACSATLCFAQTADATKLVLFRDKVLYEPLLGETRPARTMLLIPAWSKEFPDSVEPGNRFAWQITLGDELPIFYISNSLTNGRLAKGKWGVGLWIPISFHVIEDFKDTSNPIVDTDYRFGFMSKAQFGMGPASLAFRFVPWAHESTHLGDEYTILAQRNPAFERVNVSHEDWEYGVSLEGDNWAIRHGGIAPWNSDGYYSDHLLGSDEATLTTSKKNFEPIFGGEYRFPELERLGRQPYVSGEFRNKLVYNYHQTADNPERRQWSYNLQAGFSVPPGTSGTPLKAFFAQYYRGVNPYGQLRSQADFWSAGVGFIFGL